MMNLIRVACGAFFLILIAAQTSAVSAQSWAASATSAFPTMRGNIDLGRAPDALPLHIAVGLMARNHSTLQQLLRRQTTPGDPLYGRFLTPAESASLFSPRGTQVQAVASYLQRSGFSNVRVTPDNLILSADGNVRTVNAAFATEMHVLALNGTRIYANARPALIPRTLAGTIVSVEGLHSFPFHKAIKRRNANLFAQAKTSATACTEVPVLDICALNEFGPVDFQKVYDGTKASTGSLTTIAIFAEGALGQVVTDLRTQEKQSGLPQVPTTIVPTGIASTDTSGADEFDLDTQYSTGMAQDVKQLYIYDAPSLTDADTSIEFDRFKTDDLAKAGSASFGECEVFASTDGSMLQDDEIFSEAAAQGQTVFASAGDTGTFCPAPVVSMNGVPAGLPFQEYPASSPYVVAVGGTTLIANPDGTYNGEIGWDSGGGGPSLLESPGAWQSGVVNVVASEAGARAVPDIAMDADPNTGANVIVSGTSEEVGGTSLSSPLALGVWARLESAHKNALGFASPLLYGEFSKDFTSSATLPTELTQPVGGFHDVLVGANPLPAGPGYDFSTGLGTLDIGLQVKDI